ncbi:oligoendopeptidase F [Bacillus toyonensis]|uniref:M3 family oligoendopeptidase n=1 Tax=Bacillus toyonensis TaxID=155322 RepID=UPI000BEBC3CD|nr:M3 family oligoendopeptidase [Bacillus toyonensis]PED90005.1 oligoendopeptidase F [Bacillus toyonensis]PEK43069.1 oligoendopeptidase F [Bacillus toyonensis]PFZ33048.1 oligoendopeptidase F [Bacillus toyonensis]
MSMKHIYKKENLNIRDHVQLETIFKDLLYQSINNVHDLENFLLIESDILMQIHDEITRHSIDFHCDINNDYKRKIFEEIQSNTVVLVEKYSYLLSEKLSKNKFVEQLNPKIYGFLTKRKRNLTALFRMENLELQAEVDRLTMEYESIMGNLTVTWDGETKRLPQMQIFLKSPNRTVRENAWRAIQSQTLNVKSSIDSIMDKMIQLQNQIAINAGYSDFVQYMFRKYERFDYTLEDCKKFHESIRLHVVPLLDQIQSRHKKELGLENYRPWDEQGVPIGQRPLKPFTTHMELIEKIIDLFSQIDPKFGEVIQSLHDNQLLDLECRSSKAPGGFTVPLYMTSNSFIFMNATNTQFDLQTVIHEAGHAIHATLSGQGQSLFMYKNPSIEVGELASQSMELLTMDKWNMFYSNSKDLELAKREQIEGIIIFLVWIAFVDSFQIWMYTNPFHTAEEREEKVIELSLQFNNHFIDWSGLEKEMTLRWQRLMHIFVAPLYYIEYGISQLGALQLWKAYKEHPKKTIDNLKSALAMGSSRSMTEIYTAAGISFNFSEELLAELTLYCKEYLESLE